MMIALGPLLSLLILGLHLLFPLPEFPFLLPVFAIAVWMLTWWIQKPVNIGITSLLPIIAFPLLGVLPVDSILTTYLSDIILLFLGGFLIGLLLEKWHLHELLALYIIRHSGNSLRSIVFGLMLASFTISMWISNTATAIMMLPIAASVLKAYQSKVSESLYVRLRTAGLLGVAYGANIGGIATLIGTPPNIVLKGFLSQQGIELGFLNWALIGIPFSLLFLLATYLIFVRFLFVLPTAHLYSVDSAKLIANHQAKQGLSTAQKRALVLFAIAAFLWISAQAWNALLAYLSFSFRFTDSGIAISIALLAFILPASAAKGQRLLSVKQLPNVSWSILLMFGGGMAMAKALQEAGFITLIGKLTHNLPPSAWVLAALFFIVVCVFLTELMSNVALITIVLPMIIAVSFSLQLKSPLLLTVPATIASSLAFMMPIATPPNAVVFATGDIALSTMIKAGFWLNVLSVVSLFLLVLILYACYE